MMARWGKPQRMRVDNGVPWGTNSKVPSALALWLVGNGMEVIYSRPAQSTDNAIVERSHGTLVRWVEPHSCRDYAMLEQRLQWAVERQRDGLVCCEGKTRWQAHPEWFTNLRPYDAQSEQQDWSLEQVAKYLGSFRFRRKVEVNGRTNLFANEYAAGRKFAGQILTLSLDVVTRQWVMTNDAGKEIRRHDAKELSYEKISQLRLGRTRRNRHKSVSS